MGNVCPNVYVVVAVRSDHDCASCYCRYAAVPGWPFCLCQLRRTGRGLTVRQMAAGGRAVDQRGVPHPLPAGAARTLLLL
eukprot:7539884-Pyramimonas_sp.AAC.1